MSQEIQQLQNKHNQKVFFQYLDSHAIHAYQITDFGHRYKEKQWQIVCVK